MAVSNIEMAEFRRISGLNQTQFAKLLNEMLGMRYSTSSISRWETGTSTIPEYVQEAVEGLMEGYHPMPEESNGDAVVKEAERILASDTPEAPRTSDPPTRPARPPDSAPLPPPGALIGHVPTMAELCIEMFRGIGQMVEFFAVISGQPKVLSIEGPNGPQLISLIEMDGRVVTADAEVLGNAWAKLAASNAWVARVITQLTTGGAWVEVVAATSGTVVKVFRVHADYNTWVAAQAEPRRVSGQSADTETTTN